MRKCQGKRKKALSLALALFYTMTGIQTITIPQCAESAERFIEHNGSLGEILRTIMAQYGKNIVFGADVANIPVSLVIENSNFEELIYMLEIAANVEITKIGKDSYSVKTFSEAQKIRDTQMAEKDRVALLEKNARELESEKQRTFNETMTRLGNTEVRLFDVKFVAVEDLEKAIQEVLGEDFKDVVRVKSLSVGGARNYSSVLVSAPSQQIIDRVGGLIKSIDREKPMIEIEALFVEVTLNDQDELGVDWSIFPDALEYKEVPAIMDTSMGDIFNGRYLGRFVRTSGASVSAQLKHLAESGKGRVLANPKIRTMSGRKSIFASEIQEPIMSLNGDNEVRVDYKNVGISLEALATVLDDGSIYMKVIPKSSSITGEKVLKDSTAPQISERKVEAEVILNPNETMIMSGLMYDRDFTTKTRVPVLSSIPLVGELFKSSERKNERYQILIYIRPKLISVEAGASGDNERSDEIAAIWKRYSNTQRAIDSLDPNKTGMVSEDNKPIPIVTANTVNSTTVALAPAPIETSENIATPAPVLEVKPDTSSDTKENSDVEVKNAEKEAELKAQRERDVAERKKADEEKLNEKKELEDKSGTRLRKRRYNDDEAANRFNDLVNSYKE